MKKTKKKPARRATTIVRRRLPTIPGMVVVPLGNGAFIFSSPGVTGSVSYTALDGTVKTATFST